HDWEAEVKRDRHGTEHRHNNAQPEARGDAIVVDRHGAFHRAGIDKDHSIEMIRGQDRHLIFEAVEPFEVAADFEAAYHRADAAKLEAAHAAIAARIEALEDRRMRPGIRKLGARDEDVLAAFVGALV